MAGLPRVLSCAAGVALFVACTETARPTDAPAASKAAGDSGGGGTCTGTFPSYWQDPDPRFAGMWQGQTVSNAPPEGWTGPRFRLSDAFPTAPVDDAASQQWRDRRFDALFEPSTGEADRTRLARDYSWAVMRYVQEGNIDSGDVSTDWTLCGNPVRRWYHMPFQTYDALSSREFVHGLTREAPVSFSVKAKDHPGASLTLNTTMWAVAFFNPTAAYTLGTVWKPDGTAAVPTADVTFHEGAVVGKLLFSTATPAQLPMLENVPAWTANISDPAFCQCRPATGTECTMVEESRQCARSTEAWGPVRLLQFDVAIKDGRARGTQRVFGTFVADGQRRAKEPNPWNRIAPLGLMWGNDPPLTGQVARSHPPDPRKNGFREEVIFWDTVDMLNAAGGEVLPKQPGHLGCNSRLNGPADNANSSCMSCHMTASVPDASLRTPSIIAQFGSRKPDGTPGLTYECVTPDASDPSRGRDAANAAASVVDGITFAQMDGVYFANTAAGAPVDMTVKTPEGPRNVLGDQPQHADGRTTWVSLDYSLQLSISLTQWGQWRQHQGQAAKAARVHSATLPAR